MNKALLIGINRYPTAPLKGCVNDIADMANFLVDRCGFPRAQIRLLADERATTPAVLEHLHWLVDGARPGDRLFFQFSGHGVQMATRDHQGEIDGSDEVICPVDFDWTDEHVVRDKDFKRIFGAVPPGCEFVWVSDSCSSRDLSKQMPRQGVLARRFPEPADIAWRNEAAVSQEVQPLTLARAIEHTNSVALISGCASDGTSGDGLFQGRPNGVLTYYLLECLLQGGMEVPLDDLVKEVVRRVKEANYRQVPGIEGSEEIVRKPFLSRN